MSTVTMHAMKNMSMNVFADILAHVMIHNNLEGSIAEINRASTRLAARETAEGRKRQRDPTLLPPAHVGHTQVTSGTSASGSTRQLRCKWCRVFEDDATKYTSYRCQEFGVALCVKNNSANSRDCFGKHQRASQEELRMLTATANIRTTKRHKSTAPTEQQ